jgi:hypothetical protein
VIPTVVVVGLLLGRWWKITVPVTVLGWPILLIATGVDSGFGFRSALDSSPRRMSLLAFLPIRLSDWLLAAPQRRQDTSRPKADAFSALPAPTPSRARVSCPWTEPVYAQGALSAD